MVKILSNSLPSQILAWTCGLLGIPANLYVCIACILHFIYWKKSTTTIIPMIQNGGDDNGNGENQQIPKFIVKNSPTFSKISSLLFLSLGFADLFTSLYLLTLAVADVDYASFNDSIVSPKYSCNNSQKTSQLSIAWINSPLCHILRFIVVTGAVASVSTTFIITIDRFFSIVYPFKLHLKLTFTTAAQACCVAWLLAITFGGIACGITIATIKQTFCDISWYNKLCLIDDAENPNVRVFMLIVSVGICLAYTSVAVLYTLILIGIHKINTHKQFLGNRTNAKQSSGIELGVTITGLIVAAGVLCWIPTAVTSVLHIIPEIPYYEDVFVESGTVITLVFTVNALINPIIFIILSLRYTHKRKYRTLAHSASISNIRNTSARVHRVVQHRLPMSQHYLSPNSAPTDEDNT